MQTVYKPYNQVPQLSSSDVAYAQADQRLRPFYKYAVELAAFEQVIADKQNDHTNREVLVKVLQEQYDGVNTSTAVLNNIDSLRNKNTFTVITAHQPSLFTGPLYFIYKTITAINLAKELKATYPAYNFVPVFWLGSEDHDFEEINHFHLFNKTITWENDEQGPTGMMTTETLQPVLDELKDILGNSDNAQTICQKLVAAYQSGNDFGRSTFLFVNELFKEYGVVVALTSHKALKELFIPIMEEEIFEQPSIHLIEKTIAQKEALGLKNQATPREINLFYMKKGIRERIVEEGGKYQVLHQNISFTKEELKNELHQHPEHFSPNVVMRPLYQELIFPNLAYIGGGGELAYWRERLTQFEHFGINFPMLIRRNSVLWIDKGSQKRMDKLGLSVDDIFKDVDELIRNYLHENSKEELTITEQKATIDKMYDEISEQAKRVDPTLEKAVLAEKTRQMKSLDQLETRLIRAEKKKHETAVNQIRSLIEKLFPANGLQERYDNFLSFYLKHGDNFIARLVEELEPLNKDFAIIIE